MLRENPHCKYSNTETWAFAVCVPQLASHALQTKSLENIPSPVEARRSFEDRTKTAFNIHTHNQQNNKFAYIWDRKKYMTFVFFSCESSKNLVCSVCWSHAHTHKHTLLCFVDWAKVFEFVFVCLAFFADFLLNISKIQHTHTHISFNKTHTHIHTHTNIYYYRKVSSTTQKEKSTSLHSYHTQNGG